MFRPRRKGRPLCGAAVCAAVQLFALVAQVCGASGRQMGEDAASPWLEEWSTTTTVDDREASEVTTDGTDRTEVWQDEWSSTSTTSVDHESDEAPPGSNDVPGDAVTRRTALESDRFREHIRELKRTSARLDVVFLIDASSSVGPANFHSELRFVKKLLGDLDVSVNGTRVALVTFSSRAKVTRHVDQISGPPSPANDKCRLLNAQLPAIRYSGGGTYTYGALREAEAIFEAGGAGPAARRAIFLITDGYSNGPSPVPVAERLRATGVTLFAIGIETGNDGELARLVTSAAHRYLLTSFEQFEVLVRQALHLDYRAGPSFPVDSVAACDGLCAGASERTAAGGCCDERAVCSCSPTSGHYRCACGPGYAGTGLHGECAPCPVGTFWRAGGFCEACRSARHITLQQGATSERECVCPHGYQENEDGRCVAITCPRLRAPEHGYFVMDPKPCGQVLNAACGARCRPGYELTGSSIRLCQETGEWSGMAAKCTMRTCPPLSIPYYGMAVCSNPDLDLYYDYTPRNKSFLQNYSETAERLTEAMPVDTECAFKCGPGFYLKGSHQRYCLPLSKWDGLQTTCKQILCPALPRVPFGTYDPTDCADGKSAFGTNCTLVCDFGFEMRGGPAAKQCGGRRTGVWSKAPKTPRCVDVLPPHLECPGNYTVLLDDDYPYALVRRLAQPYAYDNSGDNFTYWAKPPLREADGGSRLPLGDHEYTYVAVDAFKNRARCSFTVSVVDRTPPVLEQCRDPAPQYVSAAGNPGELLVQWDEPYAHDNAGPDGLTVTASVAFGHLPVGVHPVRYRAVDRAGNAAECALRVEVRQYSCDAVVPRPPHHGLSVCAGNASHVWCELGCTGEHAFHDQPDATVALVCDRGRPSWRPGMEVPECSAVVQPAGVERVLTIRLPAAGGGGDGDAPDALCRDPDALAEVAQAFSDGLLQALCGAQENCVLLSTLPACAGPDQPAGPAVVNGTEYRIVRRRSAPSSNEAATEPPAADRATVKVVVYKRVSQELGMWRPDGKQSENIKRIKEELGKINGNKKLRRRLGTLNLDLSVLRLDEKIRCANGSIARKLVCVHCPRGTYHNYTTNGCAGCPIGTHNEQTGQSACRPCPPHHLTRRPGAKHTSECKAQCPPGTIAKLKPLKKPPKGGAADTPSAAKYQKTLQPFCRACEPGQYQGQYNRAQCQACPAGHSAPRGSTRPADCFPVRVQACGEPGNVTTTTTPPPVCGPYGRCVPEAAFAEGYACACEEPAVGAHCELLLDACASAPCLNGGRCLRAVRPGAGFECACVPPYTGGRLCDEFVDPCRNDSCANGGSCVVTDGGHAACECPPGLEGDRCERRTDSCRAAPCEGGGVCVNVGDGYRCVCPPGKTGRRCQLEPCDYLPCPAGALCIHGGVGGEAGDDGPKGGSGRLLTVLQQGRPASYRCVCPAGLRDPNCTTVDNPCETSLRAHCRNGALCEPVRLRSGNARAAVDGPPDDYDDEGYRTVRCHCPPGYYGDRCEQYLSVDFALDYPRSGGVHAYAAIAPRPTGPPDGGYGALGVCGWYQTDDDFNYGALLSYATATEDNALTLTDYSGLVLYVNGAHAVTNVSLNDGAWHFLCLSWAAAGGGHYELYLDGELRASGRNLSAGTPVPPGGLFVFGQEQDGLGGGFSETEAFRGRMAYVDVWARPLPAPEVQRLYRTCAAYHGDLVRWTDARLRTFGRVRIEPSGFCGACPRNHSLPHGAVRYEGLRALFRCDEGYELIGAPAADCLRTSRWSPGVQFCKLIRCGTVAAPANGQVTLSKASYGGSARFGCDEGFVLAGPDTLHCTAGATWSGPAPDCISVSKCAPLALPAGAGLEPIIYATERAALGRPLPGYDVGVLAEVRCAPGFALDGENLLTCGEGGQWDLPLPACVPVTDAAPTATTTSLPSMIVRVNRRPDVHFWKHLKDYLLHGCTGNDSFPAPHRGPSLFCQFPGAGGAWTDLGGFSLHRDSPHGASIDVQLLACLMRTADGGGGDGQLQPNSLLPYVLYGTLEPPADASRLPPPLEDAYRFVICQFIDVILMDRELNYDGELVVDVAREENTNAKIKHLLKHTVRPIYRQYQRWVAERGAPDAAALGCPMSLLPSPPIDGRVVAADLHGGPRAPRLDRLRASDLAAAVGDRVRYGCVEGFSMRGSGVSECTAGGHWTLPDGFCEGALCEDPPARPNMLIAPASRDTHYYVDDEIEFLCAAGYTVQGHPLVKCRPDGRWSPIMARCTRISCGRPKIPPGATIVTGSSFLHGDALTVRCPRRTSEIVCQPSGQWTPLDDC